MRSLGYNRLIPLVPLALNTVHNGFHYGTVAYRNEVENRAIDLYGWFKIAPCKWVGFQLVGEELS